MQTGSLGNNREYSYRALNQGEGTAFKNSYGQDVMAVIGTAINDKVCLDLGYQDGHRLIVPEGVKLSKAGNLLLKTKRRVEGELVDRVYRVDRIQSAEIINLTAKNMLTGACGVALIEASINSESPLSTPPAE